jgi:hypothetical protein
MGACSLAHGIVKDKGAVVSILKLGVPRAGFGGKEHGDEGRSRILSVSLKCRSTCSKSASSFRHEGERNWTTQCPQEHLEMKGIVLLS